MKQTGIATLALLLALNVALGTILGAGMKAYAADTYGLRVGGTEITSEQLTVNGDTGTATYDPETHTLTLNNYKYNGYGYYVSGEGGGIDYRGDADLLIILQGSNSITKSATSNPDRSHGIYFNVQGHTLTISGDGSLEISFAEATSGIEKRNGIFCEPGSFVMESGSVVTKGGYANESAGIFVQDCITINGGTFTGTGNPTPTNGYQSRGIYNLYDGIIINGGEVTAQATNDTNEARAFEGSVTINGGEVTASASSNGEAKAFSDSCNISVASELLEMKVGDSKETATATTNTGDVSGKKYVYIKVNEGEDINPTVSITGWIYGEYSETANAPSVTGNTGNGTVTYSYKVKDAEDSTYTSTVPTDAGDYTVQASIAAAGKYKAGSATADFTVSKADPTIKAPTTQELSYTGTAQALVTAGTTTGGTMVYALGTSTAATNDYSASIPTAIDEGTYYVWYKVSGDTNYKDSDPDVVSVTITLTRYTITYDMNNGGTNAENNPSSYTMKSGDIKLTVPTSTRTGYEFTGWLLNGDASFVLSKDVTIPRGTSGNLTYIANWGKIIYSITYDLDGGTATPANPISYDIESSDIHLTSPDKPAYTFIGWSGTDIDTTTGYSMDVTIPTGSIGNRSYSAHYKPITYALSYDLVGGTVSPENPKSYDIESEDIHLTRPTKPAYTFIGWTGTGFNGYSLDVTIPQGSSQDREYVAHYIPTTYPISYDLDGGTVSGTNPVSYDIESNDIPLISPDKPAYTFIGWTGTGLTEYSTDVTIPKGSSGDRNYKANYTPTTYRLSYDLVGGTASPANPVSYDIESDDIHLTSPDKAGYTFIGWTGSVDVASSLDVIIPKGSSADRSYTAHYTIIVYEISYDLNGSTNDPTNPTRYTVESDNITLKAPTKTGYTFNSWTLNGAAIAQIVKGSTGDKRLTATFSPITYTITYNLNGGTNNSSNPASYNIESETITLNAPTKGGYTFTGWTMDGATVTQIPANSTGNKTLTATFTPIIYTITYELDGGTNDEANPSSYTIETDTITLKEPTKADHDFAGWTLDGVEVTEIPEGSSGDKTITANWGDIAPVLSAANYSLEAKEGEPTSLTINAAGLNLSWNLDGALPSGLAFSGEGSTASISGTPEAGTAGTYPVKVIAANKGGAASADVMITVASAGTESKDMTSRDVKRNEPVTIVADSGASTTHTTTTLTDSEGNVLLAAVIAITTESEEFAAVVGEEFSTRVNVDVSIDIRSTSYDKYAYLMEIFGLPEWLKTDGTLESSGTLEAGQHYEFTLTGTPVASQDAQSVVFAATVMITGDTPEIEAYADKEVMLAVKVEAASGDITPKPGDSDQSPDVTPKPGDSDQSPDVTPKPGDSDQSPDVAPEHVVIEKGKITINADDSGGSIAEIIANMTDEEKRSITKLEINSEVQSLEWISEFANLKGLTIGENASVEELDLSGNTSITELKTHGANVKSINVSGCTHLVTLDCSSCGLESINLSGCISLNILNIRDNGLLLFNAGNLASLRELICDSQVIYMKSTGKIFALGEYFSASSFAGSASGVENVKNLKAFDASGSEIAAELDSVTGIASFSESPSKITYDYDTCFSGVMMDVTVYFTGSSTEESGRVGSSSGGCNSAFGLLTIYAGLILILLKRR